MSSTTATILMIICAGAFLFSLIPFFVQIRNSYKKVRKYTIKDSKGETAVLYLDRKNDPDELLHFTDVLLGRS